MNTPFDDGHTLSKRTYEKYFHMEQQSTIKKTKCLRSILFTSKLDCSRSNKAAIRVKVRSNFKQPPDFSEEKR